MTRHNALSEALKADPRLSNHPDWIQAYAAFHVALLDRLLSGADIAATSSDIAALARIGEHRT